MKQQDPPVTTPSSQKQKGYNEAGASGSVKAESC